MGRSPGRPDLVAEDAPYRRALAWLEALRRLAGGSSRFATLRRLRELHLGPVPVREGRLEAERRAALSTLDAVEAGVRITSGRDWLDRLAFDAALVAGARIPLHCPRCTTALRVRGARGTVRLACPRWRCRWRARTACEAEPGQAASRRVR